MFGLAFTIASLMVHGASIKSADEKDIPSGINNDSTRNNNDEDMQTILNSRDEAKVAQQKKDKYDEEGFKKTGA